MGTNSELLSNLYDRSSCSSRCTCNQGKMRGWMVTGDCEEERRVEDEVEGGQVFLSLIRSPGNRWETA